MKVVAGGGGCRIWRIAEDIMAEGELAPTNPGINAVHLIYLGDVEFDARSRITLINRHYDGS